MPQNRRFLPSDPLGWLAAPCYDVAMKKQTGVIPPHSEAAILERIIEPQRHDLSPELARQLLSWKFPHTDVERMNDLSAKAREGTLTPQEDRELDGYIRIGHFLSMVKSKARMALKNASDTASPKHGSRP